MKSNNILSSLLILFMILGVSSCKDDVTTPNDNSECIKCNDYEVGETFSIDGVTYKVADREILDDALQNGEDLTKYCTSKVTNMVGMFNYASSFNGDINKWDVNNVTDMGGMFRGTTSFNQDLTNWCVRNFDSEPEEFSLNSGLSPENHPIWGTCP